VSIGGGQSKVSDPFKQIDSKQDCEATPGFLTNGPCSGMPPGPRWLGGTARLAGELRAANLVRPSGSHFIAEAGSPPPPPARWAAGGGASCDAAALLDQKKLRFQ
jgi:hypothetical protein